MAPRTRNQAVARPEWTRNRVIKDPFVDDEGEGSPGPGSSGPARSEGPAPPDEAGPEGGLAWLREAALEDLTPAPLPITAGNVVVRDLGRISLRKSIMTGPHGGPGSRYLWPVGFRSRRPYMSVEDPSKRIWYESNIVEDDTDRLKIVVTALDGSNVRFEGDNPTAAWNAVLTAVNEITLTRERVAVSGPQFMGLSDVVVQRELAKLPGYFEAKRRQEAALEAHRAQQQAPLARGPRSRDS